MTELAVFNKLVKEQEKQEKRKRVRQLLLTSLLLILAVDYLVFWPRASKTQKELERTLNGFPFPPDSVQVGFDSGHQPGKGFAWKELRSTTSPQKVCDFYLARLSADGWQITHEDCSPRFPDGSLWPDTASGHILLELRKAENTCRVKYYAPQAGKNKYVVLLAWSRL